MDALKQDTLVGSFCIARGGWQRRGKNLAMLIKMMTLI
jgi:hypothetical protein